MGQPYTLFLFISIVIPAYLSISVIKQRPNLGARSFAMLMATVSLWALVALIEVCSKDDATKIFSYGLKYLFIVSAPLAWLVFSLYYSNLVRRVRWSFLAAIFVLPAATLVLVATNHYHHWMFSAFEMVRTGSYYLLYPHFGPWFWIHTGYCYIAMAIGFLLLTRHLLSTPAHFKRQVVSLMIGGATPWISNTIFIFKLDLLPYFDLTPIAFSVTGIAFMWGILRYRMLDIVPIARDNVIQHMDDGVIIVDAGNHILDLNPSACLLTGKRPKELIGVKAEKAIEWWPDFESADRYPNDPSGRVIELEVHQRRRLIRPTRSCLYSNDQAMGHLITLRDVTGRLRAEKALRNSEERFKSLSENAPIIIFTLNEKGVVTYVNQAWEHILGHKRSQLLGRPFIEIILPSRTQNYASIFAQLFNGQQSIAEVKIHIRDTEGSRRLFNTTATANSDAEGRVNGIIGLAKDVTEAQRLQEQLFQSQKMKAVGTLAGGIAHDFNNLLMGVQANVSLIRHEIDPSNEVLSEKLNRIEDQIQSGASLTRQLLGYARKGKNVVDVIDLNELVMETLNVVERTNKRIQVECELTSESSHIRADKGQIELVLLNLFLNAVDAMPAGGQLTVNSRSIPGGDPTSDGTQTQQELNIELTINDTGVGMDAETKARIFEPFFTTKEVGQGTGLGLASVYGIVENHGGRIQVESRIGQGTTFRILLPSAEKKIIPITPRRPTELPKSGGKILLVDDEELVLKSCHEMVESLGYEVISTTKPGDALSIYQTRHQQLDLVILDMIMPEMDGAEVFDQLVSINPKIKAIIISGYVDDGRIDTILASGRHDRLRKPFTSFELSQSIARVLNLP
jgi:PAS domain S-box-containing protein